MARSKKSKQSTASTHTMSQNALNQANDTPPVVVQNLVVRPVNRKTQDIGSWRNALRAAEASNPRRVELYDLYDDILLDGHLDSVIDKRIMAVTNAEWQFVKDGKIITKVNDLVDTLAFEELLQGIMSSRFWGYAMMEFAFNKQGRFTLYDVPKKHMRPHTGIVSFEQTGDSGLNIREGIYLNTVMEVGKPKDLGKLLKAAQYAIYKRGSFGDWSQFAELFGMPFRVGTYDGFDESQRIQLETALEKMGGAAYVVKPNGSTIEFLENKTNSDGRLYDLLKDACNKEMSKVILGQTMTTESGSSRSQGEVHKEVEESINLADRIFVRRLLNTRFIEILQANGIDTQGGWFSIKGEGEEHLTKEQRLNMVIKLKKDGGLPVDDDFLYEEFDIPKPANYDTLKNEIESKKTVVTVPEPTPTPAAKTGKTTKKPKQKEQNPDAETTELAHADGESIIRKVQEAADKYIQELKGFFA